jgi:uncharacterized membrane protein
MPDLALILAALGVVFAALGAAAALASAIIQHRRTPKLPEPSITPICTTILGVGMYDHVRDLPGIVRSRPEHC